MAVIDLSQLPAPDVVETLDFEAILAERNATLISLYPEDEQEAVARTLTLESDPLVKYLEENQIQGKQILFLHTGGTPLFFDFLEQEDK